MSSTTTVAVATLRRFLMQVHPDLIPSLSERRINSINVGLLQSYIRDQTYTGSASLIFYKKPGMATDKFLQEVRVVVGRGVDKSVESMRIALGEAVKPVDNKKPIDTRPQEVVADLLRQRRRQDHRERKDETLWTFVEGLDREDLKRKRRAAQHAAARAARLVKRSGLAKIESRCGWQPRRVSQILAAVDSALSGDLRGFTLVISTTDKKPIDPVEGLIHLSPSRQLVDWKRTFTKATSELTQQRASYEDRRRSKLHRVHDLFKGICTLEKGATLTAADFENFLDTLLQEQLDDDDDEQDDRGDDKEDDDDIVVVRVERDGPPSLLSEESLCREEYQRVGFVLVSPPVSRKAILKAVESLEDSDIADVARRRRKITALGDECLKKLGLRELELYFDGQPSSQRIPKETSSFLTLSGAHRPHGASLPEMENALQRLRDQLPEKSLNDVSLAIIGKGRLSANDLGQILVPVDFR